MEETPDQETARLLAPYIARRNELAHECLSALLSGIHEGSQALLQEYQMAEFNLRAAEDLCGWFDAGTAAQHIVIEFGDQDSANRE